MDELTPLAAGVGAVNTVIRKENGHWLGHNTDVFGIAHVLGHTEYDRALIIGAGGVARAAVRALNGNRRHHISLINRTQARAQSVADTIGTQVVVRPWSELWSAISQSDIVINTVPLWAGEKPSPQLDQDPPRPSTWLELSYGVEAGSWGNQLSKHGIFVVDGRRVLVHQGRASFTSWTGQSIPEQVAETALDF